jgi:transcription initiation factor IIE alpha subunit
MMPMDKPMDKPMDDKDSKFKCPACGEMLSVESAGQDKAEDMPSDKPMDKSMGERADKMPMDKLKNVLMSAKPKPEPQGY